MPVKTGIQRWGVRPPLRSLSSWKRGAEVYRALSRVSWIPAEAGIQETPDEAIRCYAVWLAASAGSNAWTMFSYSAEMRGLDSTAGFDMSM